MSLNIYRSRLADSLAKIMVLSIFVTSLVFFSSMRGIKAQLRLGQSSLINHEYVLALAAANQFLNAWQEGNHIRGLAMMSDSLKKKHSEDELRAYFADHAGPGYAAFEIGPGQYLRNGSVEFDVRKYSLNGYRWLPPSTLRQPASSIVIRRVSQGLWLVDEVP